MLSDDARRIAAPVVVSPVNQILSTRGSLTERVADHAARARGATDTQPSGTPASTSSSPSSSAVSGVSDAGLMITALPHASAGAVFQRRDQEREVPRHDQRAHADRLAQHDVEARRPGTGTTSPNSLFAAPA